MKHAIVTNNDYLKATEPKYELFKKLISDIPEGSKVLDLGAGHCRYTNICAEKGLLTTAVDARNVRVPELHENAIFKKADVLSLKKEFFDGFDVILCFGLLYHLTASEALALLKKCNSAKLVLVDTHFCKNSDAKAEDAGYRGKFYKEASNQKAMMANPKASVSTLKSFWPGYSEQLRMFADAGFDQCSEVRPYHHPFRTFFVLQP